MSVGRSVGGLQRQLAEVAINAFNRRGVQPTDRLHGDLDEDESSSADRHSTISLSRQMKRRSAAPHRTLAACKTSTRRTDGRTAGGAMDEGQ